MRAVPLAIACLAACGRAGFEPLVDSAGPDPRLASITLWAGPGDPLAAPMTPGFAPEVSGYGVSLGLAASSLQISAIPIDPQTTITIEDATTAAAALSAPLALPLGTRIVHVIGTAANGATATYAISIGRASTLAQRTYVKASNTGATDSFGFSLAIDGDTLVIGAPLEDSGSTGVNGNQLDESATNAGAAYVFTRSGSTWSQQAYLKASNTRAGAAFGQSVAVFGDTLAVGADNESSNATGIDGNQMDTSLSGAGAVYVFTRTAGVWSQEAYVKASNTGNDFFGERVALSGDTLAVGAYTEASAATGIGGDQASNAAPAAGAAYVFVRTAGVWTQQAYIKASNTGAGDFFGYRIALSGDTLVVGAPAEGSSASGIDGNQNDNSAGTSGAVYVFTRQAGTWSQQAYVKASNTGGGDQFGFAVAISDDTLVVGANLESSNAVGIDGDQANNAAASSGAAYVFTRTAGTWSQQAYLKASNTDANDGFGGAAAISADTLVIGADGEASASTGVDANQADNSKTGAGAIYVFGRTAGVWTQLKYVKTSFVSVNYAFGYTLALSGDTIAAAVNQESSNATGIDGDPTNMLATDSGAVYLFQ